MMLLAAMKQKDLYKPTPLNSRNSTSLLPPPAHSISSLTSPFTRPPKPTPFNSRNLTSLLHMFRKISSAAAADAHSFSSPFTRPPKPTPLTSRNSTSFLQMFRKISSAAADAHSFSSLSSPITRPPKPTLLNSRNLTSLLQMFRKISSAAAADAHSFSSPFTRPPKPTPLTSRNSTSFLQMFRKISSAAADAHSFSSLASPPNGKLSSLVTRPPKPTPLNSRNSRSLFTYAENSHDEPKIGVSTARLQKFLQTNCKSGDVSADEAFRFFHCMVKMEPRFRLYSFNLLLNGLAKNKRYCDVLSLYGKMNSGGLTPNFMTLNILLNSFCNANQVCDAFLVMGRILRKGYNPTIMTFNSLIEGLLIGNRVDDAVQLFLRLEKFDCHPDVITLRTMCHRLRLCRLRYTSNARKLREEKVSGNGQYSVRWKQNVVSYSCINDSLCKEGKDDKTKELISNIDVPREAINHSRPTPWLRLFCNTLALRTGNDVKGEEELKPTFIARRRPPLVWLGRHRVINSIYKQ